jgi:hypothetical protein
MASQQVETDGLLQNRTRRVPFLDPFFWGSHSSCQFVVQQSSSAVLGCNNRTRIRRHGVQMGHRVPIPWGDLRQMLSLGRPLVSDNWTWGERHLQTTPARSSPLQDLLGLLSPPTCLGLPCLLLHLPALFGIETRIWQSISTSFRTLLTWGRPRTESRLGPKIQQSTVVSFRWESD